MEHMLEQSAKKCLCELQYRILDGRYELMLDCQYRGRAWSATINCRAMSENNSVGTLRHEMKWRRAGKKLFSSHVCVELKVNSTNSQAHEQENQNLEPGMSVQ